MMLYLADVTNGLSVLFAILALVFGFASMFSVMLLVQKDIQSKAIPLIMTVAMLTSGILSALMPSKETVYLIAATKYGQELIEKPQVKQLGDKILNILNEKLDSLVEKKSK